MLPVELLVLSTYALGVLTETLYGENRELVSQVNTQMRIHVLYVSLFTLSNNQ